MAIALTVHQCCGTGVEQILLCSCPTSAQSPRLHTKLPSRPTPGEVHTAQTTPLLLLLLLLRLQLLLELQNVPLLHGTPPMAPLLATHPPADTLMPAPHMQMMRRTRPVRMSSATPSRSKLGSRLGGACTGPQGSELWRRGERGSGGGWAAMPAPVAAGKTEHRGCWREAEA